MKKKENEKEELQKKKEDDEGLQIVSIDDIDKIDVTASKKKKSYVFNKKLRIFITLISLAVFCFAGYQLVNILLEYKQGEELYDDLLSKYTKVSTNRGEEEEEEENGELKPFVMTDVDFVGLKKENSEIVAWIQFEHVDISYPVLKGQDNSFYLKRTATKTENKAGSIFMDCNNSEDMSDMNTIIYGHNMKDGSMFGLLSQYKNAEFYLGREHFWVYTPTANYRYVIFSCYEPKADDGNVYTIWKGASEGYKQYLDAAKAATKYPTDSSELTQDTKIVTLSTCTNRGSDYRFVVQGKLVETVNK